MRNLISSVHLCAGVLLAAAVGGCTSSAVKVEGKAAEKEKSDTHSVAVETLTVKPEAAEAAKGDARVGEEATTVETVETITVTDTAGARHGGVDGTKSYDTRMPNGDYIVKLYFSEDYEGVAEPSARVFSYAVKDGDASSGKTIKEVRDFSPWKAAWVPHKAYVDTVPVSVTAGQISITFAPVVEHPQINAIEIVPR